MAFAFITVLRMRGVPFVVAPYEADAQLAFLALQGIMLALTPVLLMAFDYMAVCSNAVITEDSDLIPFGCSRVLFKMDKSGQGQEVSTLLHRYNSLTSHSSQILRRNLPACTEISFLHWTDDMLLNMCILAGCDYLPSIPVRRHTGTCTFLSYAKQVDICYVALQNCGIKKAAALVRKHKSVARLLSVRLFDSFFRYYLQLKSIY
jgi:exonuclease-1